MLTIESGPGEVIQVPWGRVQIPGMDGHLDLGISKKNNRLVFQISVTTKRKNEPDVRVLCRLVREYLVKHSIYKGKAIKIRFKLDNGSVIEMPEPKFLVTEGLGPGDLVFSDEVADSVETNLFTPIKRMEDCRRAGIPVKRGVLLAGKFGVGKTLAARVAARLCVEHQVSYIYVTRADELSSAVEFALQYQPAVVFCEDIDRVLQGARSTSMDELLNVVDGVDSKMCEVIVVLTTNVAENINPAMLRPGRLDAVINVVEPDAKAVVKLLKYYGAGVIEEGADLERIGKKLAGQIPAVIAEVVKRSKLAALKRTPVGTNEIVVDEIALEESAITMRMQLELLKGKPAEMIHPAQPLLDKIQANVVEALSGDKLGDIIENRTRKILKEAGLPV
jgi:transitional endoplasmic reticulum ATPase